jgi:UV DNA damage endonuclease
MSSKSTISPTPTPIPSPQPKSKPSSRNISGTKRKSSSISTEEPVQNLSSTVIEAPEAREASPDEAESQNPDLDDGDQAAQTRQPAVNSDVLPIPWKGRLGFAYPPVYPH